MRRILINIQIVVRFYICLASADVFFVAAHSGTDVKGPIRVLKVGLRQGQVIGEEQLSRAEEEVYATVKARNARYDKLALKVGCAGLLACVMGAVMLYEARASKESVVSAGQEPGNTPE